jgi:hypothetical protein
MHERIAGHLVRHALICAYLCTPNAAPYTVTVKIVQYKQN